MFRRKREQPEPDLTAVLETGMTPESDASGRRLPEVDLRTLQRAWLEVGDGILQDHVAVSPMTRPWAWWVFSAEGQRLLARAHRQWLLNVIGRAGGVECRNRAAIPEFVQRGLLGDAGLLNTTETAGHA